MSEDQPVRKIDRSELEKNNGKDGQPAYVAVEGKVYDLSSSQLWDGGSHMNTHEAGKELSLAIQAAPHGMEVLEKFGTVGELAEVEESKPSEFPQPPALLDRILREHPHPVSVHFPIALSITSALFTFLALITSNSMLAKVALYNVIVATIATPFAITAGALSWYYNYGAVWTSIYRKKTFLSAQLVILQLAALVIYVSAVRGSGMAGTWYWIYSFLVLALAPTVMGLGYLGGKITFPR
jgi:predicted heme/steroid binding protein/uncharacterized membrane protein